MTATDVVVTADITPRDWFINPRTGWPWPGVIAHRGEDEALVRARRQASIEIRGLRRQMAWDRQAAAVCGLYGVIPSTHVQDAKAAIASIRRIFAPASRPAHRDLARLGTARRDAGAPAEAPIGPDASRTASSPSIPDAGGRVPPRSRTAGVGQPHPGQTSSAREPAGPRPVAPVCRAGARDVKRERRARVAQLTTVPVSSGTASRLDAEPFAAPLAARPDPLPAGRPPGRLDPGS